MIALSVGHVRRLRPDVLDEVAAGLELERGRVIAVVATVLWRRAAALTWRGPAASAASVRYAALVEHLTATAWRIGLTGQALGRASPRLRISLVLLGNADVRAAEDGARIGPDGRLVVPVRPASTDPVEAALRARRDELLRLEVGHLLGRCEGVARDADEALARDLVAAVRGGLTGLAMRSSGALSSPPGGSGTAAAFANAAWWQSLTDGERRQVATLHPEWVGPRDGIPPADRHQANLVLLARAEASAQVRLGEVKANARPWNATEGTHAQERVDDLAALREVVSQQDGTPRTLLLVDGAGTALRAAVAVGDVATAVHVATFVGGMTTSVRHDLSRYDATFARMRRQARAVAPGEDMAVVTWMGYEAPQVVDVLTIDRNVVSPAVARDNADELAAFLAGIDAARSRPVHQTVWAHSYGAVLTGFTLLQANAADDVVVFGAPGMPFTSLAQIGLKPGAFNVLRAPGDFVMAFGSAVHGLPATEVVGARWLAATAPKAAGNTWTGSHGHSEYLNSGTVSEHNLVAVATGRPDRVIDASAQERASHPSWRDLAPVL